MIYKRQSDIEVLIELRLYAVSNFKQQIYIPGLTDGRPTATAENATLTNVSKTIRVANLKNMFAA